MGKCAVCLRVCPELLLISSNNLLQILKIPANNLIRNNLKTNNYYLYLNLNL